MSTHDKGDSKDLNEPNKASDKKSSQFKTQAENDAFDNELTKLLKRMNDSIMDLDTLKVSELGKAGTEMDKTLDQIKVIMQKKQGTEEFGLINKFVKFMPGMLNHMQNAKKDSEVAKKAEAVQNMFINSETELVEGIKQIRPNSKIEM